ncbi:fluoride efflux transporter CrcB [Halomonas eurihalina]|uniref:Fluoride-specific ion channel FluC n=1 Tax=Halomonas eurihalina TaxID=42566 RepID=A0A5D9CXG0_HALER|nr:fluoride efflux transporter CrcB [Halomonas eurihalina]MDR5860972.1 fluoride efflux transporter CrcB [Halomonas eurihalina]TZG35702.1 fluoride efflux transporter CrcB [Halomonas eurihalina]
MTLGPLDWLLVVLGGALGGMARLAVTELAGRWWGRAFPWGTLVVNLGGTLGIGVLAALAGWPEAGAVGWTFLAVGVLGGFTTVSSFSLQTLTLFQEGRRNAALLNIVVTLVPGVAVAGLGWWAVGGGA